MVNKLVLNVYLNEEKLGNSGLGNGVAMPKAKLPATVSDKILTVFMQLETPVEYDAADNKPVDIVFAVLVPENHCQEYIPVLAEINEKLTDKNLIKQLRSAQSADEIWQILNVPIIQRNLRMTQI